METSRIIEPKNQLFDKMLQAAFLGVATVTMIELREKQPAVYDLVVSALKILNLK